MNFVGITGERRYKYALPVRLCTVSRWFELDRPGDDERGRRLPRRRKSIVIEARRFCTRSRYSTIKKASSRLAFSRSRLISGGMSIGIPPVRIRANRAFMIFLPCAALARVYLFNRETTGKEIKSIENAFARAVRLTEGYSARTVFERIMILFSVSLSLFRFVE